jgi:hypothetical protein
MITSGSNGSRGRTEAQDAPSRDDAAHGTPFRSVVQDARALYAYAIHYLAAQLDAAGARVRRIVLWTLAAIVTAVAGLTAIIVAVVMVLTGLARGVGLLLGGEDWAGLLVIGTGILGLIAAAGYFSIRAWSHRRAQTTRERYERRREKERSEFGTDTVQRATGGHVPGRR